MNVDLSLEVSDTYNLKIMRLFDTSFYHQDEVTDNYLIEVLPVNKKTWVTFNVKRNFELVLNSSNLRYQVATSTNSLLDLPDGVYEIKQSYKPNTKTVVHFYHLRTTALRLKYVELLCEHLSNECKKTTRVYEEEGLMLINIKEYIDAAIYAVSEQHDKDKGIKFYNQAVELMKNFENDCGCK